MTEEQQDTQIQRDEWDLFADSDEKRVLFAALDSFRQYRRTAHFNITHRRRQNFYALPTAQWQMLSAPPFNLLANLERIDGAIDANGDLADEMLGAALRSFGLQGLEASPENPAMNWHGAAGPIHLDKARSTIRQMYRDWSVEGAAERRACYDPVMQDLGEEFAHRLDKHSVRVLVPGAGLGRLVFEICRAGYTVEGNEISWHQLIASNWVLNHTLEGNTFDVYPFAAEFSNVISRDHQLKVVKIPDVHIHSALQEASGNSRTPCPDRMDMRAGDFIGMYSDKRYKNTFDAVVTVFFIDTAPNLIRYIETIQNCLKYGGVWINLGPLLWHFEDRGPAEKYESKNMERPRRDAPSVGEPGSFELTLEEVLLLVKKMGFDVERHEIRNDETNYVHNPESMLQNSYRPSHWVARKRI